MGAGGDFPIDLVILGGIALFLVLRLRSILGRREGFERPAEAPQPMPTAATPGPTAPAAPAPASRQVPDPASPLGQTLLQMAQIDANFRPDRDVLTEQGPADPYDPTASTRDFGQKMAIDATRKLDGECGV